MLGIRTVDMNTEKAFKFKRYGSLILSLASIIPAVLGHAEVSATMFALAALLYAQSVEDRLFIKGVLP